MGMWDEMCVVCGGPLSALDKEYDLYAEGLESLDVQSLESDSKWLDDRVGITDTEERVLLGAENGYGFFDLDSKPEFQFCAATVFKHMTTADRDWFLYGLTCHRKCLELLERDLQYTLRFQDVWPMLMRQEYGTWLECTDYGGIAEFIGQSFGYQGLYLDGKGWMLQDPTTNIQNGERIVKVWRDIIQSGFQAKDGSPPESVEARNELPPEPVEARIESPPESAAIDSAEEHDHNIRRLCTSTEVFKIFSDAHT